MHSRLTRGSVSGDRVKELLQPVRTHRDRNRRRSLADDCLLGGALPRETSELLSWRATELRSPKHRARLATIYRRWLAEIDGPRCRAYAVNRTAMREHRHVFVKIAEHLENTDKPAPLRGLILADRASGSDAGILADPARADELGAALASALRALEDTSPEG